MFDQGVSGHATFIHLSPPPALFHAAELKTGHSPRCLPFTVGVFVHTRLSLSSGAGFAGPPDLD